jgi:hypothetical protein
LPAVAVEPINDNPAPAVESSNDNPGPAVEPINDNPAPAVESSNDNPAPAVESSNDNPGPAVEPINDNPAPAVESSNDNPAPAASPEANIPAIPANSTSRQLRLPAPVTPSINPRGSVVVGPTVNVAVPAVVTPAAAVKVAATAAATPALIASQPEPPAATATPSGVLWDINTAVVGVLDATQNWLSSLPANPVTDLLQGALLLVRRTMFSQPATVVPVQTITTATGQFRGTFGAISPQGSPLSYTLTSDPLLGTVEVSPDGTYVYTPGVDFSEYDTFSVAVDSPGFNIFNPSGSWRPAQASVSVWGSPGDGGGPPDGALAKSLITRTFEITNLTSSNQKLTSWTAQKNRTVVNVAPVGTILEPGESTKIVLTQYAFQDLEATAGFTPVDASGAPIAAPSGAFSVNIATKPFGSVWQCGVGNCNTGTTRTVVLLDPIGTVISLPSGQGQKQADVLNAFCQAGRANCTFTSKSFDNNAWSLPQQDGSSVRNRTSSDLTKTVTVSNSQSTATELGLESEVKTTIFEIVEASVKATAKQTWTSTYTFEESITATAKPGEEVFFESSAPIKAVTGDFTVQMNGQLVVVDGEITLVYNTTWNLYDVTFDSPDADGPRKMRVDAIAVPIRV